MVSTVIKLTASNFLPTRGINKQRVSLPKSGLGLKLPTCHRLIMDSVCTNGDYGTQSHIYIVLFSRHFICPIQNPIISRPQYHHRWFSLKPRSLDTLNTSMTHHVEMEKCVWSLYQCHCFCFTSWPWHHACIECVCQLLHVWLLILYHHRTS